MLAMVNLLGLAGLDAQAAVRTSRRPPQVTVSGCSLQDTACFSGRIDSQLAEASDPSVRALKRSGFAGMNSEVGLAAVESML